MTKCILLTLTIALLESGSALAQSPSPSPSPNDTSAIQSPSPAPDAAELTQLLKDFLAGASKNDIAAHERFWAEDLIYTSSFGKRRGKADILRDVKSENSSTPASSEQTTFTAEDVRIQQYDTTAIVAFKLVGTTVKDSKVEKSYYLNTGTFLKRDNKWQVVAWQATKMSDK
jgi:ketosteroid isomerase-like protein